MFWTEIKFRQSELFSPCFFAAGQSFATRAAQQGLTGGSDHGAGGRIAAAAAAPYSAAAPWLPAAFQLERTKPLAKKWPRAPFLALASLAIGSLSTRINQRMLLGLRCRSACAAAQSAPLLSDPSSIGYKLLDFFAWLSASNRDAWTTNVARAVRLLCRTSDKTASHTLARTQIRGYSTLVDERPTRAQERREVSFSFSAMPRAYQVLRPNSLKIESQLACRHHDSRLAIYLASPMAPNFCEFVGMLETAVGTRHRQAMNGDLQDVVRSTMWLYQTPPLDRGASHADGRRAPDAVVVRAEDVASFTSSEPRHAASHWCVSSIATTRSATATGIRQVPEIRSSEPGDVSFQAGDSSYYRLPLLAHGLLGLGS